MASELSMQIRCSLCLSDFTDPVMLSCEHCFCRQCITGHMHGNGGQQCLCPECRRPYTERDVHSSRLLRNLTSAVRQHLTAQQGNANTSPAHRPQALSDIMMCVDHDEKLKLFCETDQTLVCVVCRDGEKHQGHHFKPVKEAAQIIKEIVKDALDFIVKENTQLDDMTQQQACATTRTQMRSKELSDQISAQFEEMHRFLKKKEEEIKKQLETQEQDTVRVMCKHKSTINKRLMDGKELECVFQSALAINQPDLFLQWWNEKGFPVTERMKIKKNLTPDIKYKSQVKDLSVIPYSFFIGPYETHLQFFVWKSMLGDIKPVPEILSLKDPEDSRLKVSPGKLSVRQADRQPNDHNDYNPGVVSEQTFTSGQHYWEIEVGNKFDWSIGIKTKGGIFFHFLGRKLENVYLSLINDKGYTISSKGNNLPIEINRKPSKIGLYLDCDRKQISFYDADIMTQIFVTNYKSDQPLSISLFPGNYLDGNNIDPLTVCSYVSNSAHSP